MSELEYRSCCKNIDRRAYFEAQLSQRDHTMLHVIEYVAKSLEVIRNDTLE